MTERPSQIWWEGYRAARAEIIKDWRAFIADQIAEQVWDREAVTQHEIDTRAAYRVIKWLIDHMDECSHTTLHQPGDAGNLLLTTMDNVQQWLEEMSGVLGASGYEEPEGVGDE